MGSTDTSGIDILLHPTECSLPVTNGTHDRRDSDGGATVHLSRDNPDRFWHESLAEALESRREVWCTALEMIVAVDFVTWVNCNIMQEPESQRQYTTIRHALMLTEAAMYLIEVRLNSRHTRSSTPADVGDLPPRQKRSKSILNWLTSHLDPSIVSVWSASRLIRADVRKVLLPYKSVTMRNGDEVAERSSDIVIVHSDGTHFWLQCTNNETRGILADELSQWHAQQDSGFELIMEQMVDADLMEVLQSPPTNTSTTNSPAVPPQQLRRKFSVRHSNSNASLSTYGGHGGYARANQSLGGTRKLKTDNSNCTVS